MRLYNIKDSYIDHLRKFDHRVCINKNATRPYVGVVYTINNIKYYLPLTSPKEKYAKLKNTKDFHKIAGGTYGAVNLNNMIPVLDTALIEININNHPNAQYRNLLRNQFSQLINMKELLHRKAETLYKLCTTTANVSENDSKIKSRCCNFVLLEEKMQEYVC